ncbi:MAG: hypothetical protein ACM3WU_05750 [Bacillota bacterium]
MDTDRSLSEIARSVLSDGAGGDPKSFREKAGLLALLNLLGIVEAFYGEMPAPMGSTSTALGVRDPVVDALIKTPAPAPAQDIQAPPVAPTQPDTDAGQSQPAPCPPTQSTGQVTASEGPISIVSSIAKMLGSLQPHAPPGAGSSQSGTGSAPSIASMLAGLDPALIAGLVSAVATMARARPSSRAPVKVDEQSSSEGPTESGTSAAEPEPSPEPAPPSPLQQVLGIDPKVLTLALNVLAEIMKSRSFEPKEKPVAESRASEQAASKTLSIEPRLAPSVTTRKPGARLHKPGLGIYRSPRSLIRPVPQQAQED